MRKLGRILIFGAFLNWVAFAVAAALIDGHGQNGRIENGDYLLSNHGRVTKVEPWVFHFSRGHTLSVFLTHLLGMAGFLILKMTPVARSQDSKRARAAGGLRRSSETRDSRFNS